MEKPIQLEWSTEKREISTLIEFDHNPRILTPEQESKLRESLEKFGLVEIPAVDVNGTILAGHQRLKVYQKINGNGVIDVRVPNRALTDKEREEYIIRSNKNTGEWNFDMLAESFDESELIDWGFDADEFNILDIEEGELPELNEEVPDCEQMTFLLSNEQASYIREALEEIAQKVNCEDEINTNRNGNRLHAIVREYVER